MLSEADADADADAGFAARLQASLELLVGSDGDSDKEERSGKCVHTKKPYAYTDVYKSCLWRIGNVTSRGRCDQTMNWGLIRAVQGFSQVAGRDERRG